MGNLRYYGPVPVKQEQRDAYLTRFSPAYPAVKLLNSLKGQHYTLFPLGALPMAYFADGSFIGEEFGAAHLAKVLGERGDNQRFYREL